MSDDGENNTPENNEDPDDPEIICPGPDEPTLRFWQKLATDSEFYALASSDIKAALKEAKVAKEDYPDNIDDVSAHNLMSQPEIEASLQALRKSYGLKDGQEIPPRDDCQICSFYPDNHGASEDDSSESDGG